MIFKNIIPEYQNADIGSHGGMGSTENEIHSIEILLSFSQLLIKQT